MEYFGKGIYTLSEASKLTGVDPRAISRWLRGYRYKSDTESRTSPPVIQADYEPIEGKMALSFFDMMELRLVGGFRRHHLSFAKIRLAYKAAQKQLGSSHPFAARRFLTDGKTILLQIAEESRDPDLLDLLRDQWAINDILSPVLREGLEFGEGDLPTRWHVAKGILVDPRYSFGHPVVASCFIPSATLYAAYRAEHSVEKVAHWYEIEPSDVQDAIAFETRTAA